MKIDVKGKLCPLPLIEVKKQLDKMSPGEKFEVVLDNETAKDNVFRFLSDSFCSPAVSDENGIWNISAEKGEKSINPKPAESYCSPAAVNPVVILRSCKMGIGEDELGEILMKAFVNTLKELNPKPTFLVLYNSGVFLACCDSPLVDTFKELENSGVTILVCGTCLDYYGLKKSLQVGQISNMFEILDTIAKANPPITP